MTISQQLTAEINLLSIQSTEFMYFIHRSFLVNHSRFFRELLKIPQEGGNLANGSSENLAIEITLPIDIFECGLTMIYRP